MTVPKANSVIPAINSGVDSAKKKLFETKRYPRTNPKYAKSM